MLTSIAAPAPVRSPRPAYRPFEVSVARVTRLSRNFLRITFVGDDLDQFGADCLDQRIKVVLPLEGHGFSDLSGDDGGADWYTRWRALPDAERNPLRTYTSRAVRPAVREVDIDFVCHGDTGPATRWASTARVGDPLMLIGPDALSETRGAGIEWRPGAAELLLLAGDETAAPAICGILESLPATARGSAFLEVPSSDDVLHVRLPIGMTLTWLPRNGAPHGSLLADALRCWADTSGVAERGTRRSAVERPSTVDADAPELNADAPLWETPARTPGSSLYAWLAGEAECIKRLRRFLVSEIGLDRSQVAFMGYWRAGRAEN
ncbi:siderophore-interacting protein [Planctomonas psychrotolerans]|uniref:siderophore-interacting protein n=1 Tax=Planctomonas psychrotolerans TaxID=2528712 RepID=UPI0012391F04|nr:siderophore-interacting protein [Planctomonas psychrotolerans]